MLNLPQTTQLQQALIIKNYRYCNTNLYVSTTVFITQGNM